MEKVIIIGSGGHAKVVIDILLKKENTEIIGILDDNFENISYKEILNIPILGKIELSESLPKDYSYIIAIGDNNVREKIAKRYSNLNYTTAIHPTAIVGEGVEIETGTVLMPRVVINSYSKIGKHCILNTGSIIEHDNEIGDFVHISPRALLCGGVKVEKKVWVGAGSVVIQGVTLGENSLIGAGSVVLKDVLYNLKVVGNPARAISKVS